MKSKFELKLFCKSCKLVFAKDEFNYVKYYNWYEFKNSFIICIMSRLKYMRNTSQLSDKERKEIALGLWTELDFLQRSSYAKGYRTGVLKGYKDMVGDIK